MSARVMVYRPPHSQRTFVAVGVPLREPSEDEWRGTCILSGLWLIRLLKSERSGSESLGPIIKVYRSRLFKLVQDAPMYLGRHKNLCDGIEGDPHERTWRRLNVGK